MTTTQTKDLAGRYCRVVIPVSTFPSRSVARDDKKRDLSGAPKGAPLQSTGGNLRFQRPVRRCRIAAMNFPALQRPLFTMRPDQHRAKARSRTTRFDRDQVFEIGRAHV